MKNNMSGWRERANLLRWLVEEGEVNEHNYEAQYAEHLKHTSYDPGLDELTTIQGHHVKCLAGWQCVETWRDIGIPDNPPCLRIDAE